MLGFLSKWFGARGEASGEALMETATRLMRGLTGSGEGVARYALDDVAQVDDLCDGLPCEELASDLRRALEQHAKRTRKTFVVEELQGH